MCGRLDFYLQAFTLLPFNNSNISASKAENHHVCQPLLLLSVFDLITSGRIRRNFVDISYDLAETYADYWKTIATNELSCSLASPFVGLAAADFWHLVPRPKKTSSEPTCTDSIFELKDACLGARFDEELFPLLLMKSSREKSRKVLLENSFTDQQKLKLQELAYIHREASKYSSVLMSESDLAGDGNEVEKDLPDLQIRAKWLGFKKTILSLYEHRCAICRIRAQTVEGQTVVDSSRITVEGNQPGTHDDRPQNALALCPLCRWTFDKGLIGIRDDYTILISNEIGQGGNIPAHFGELAGKRIHTPNSSKFWPDREKLAVHREKLFRGK